MLFKLPGQRLVRPEPQGTVRGRSTTDPQLDLFFGDHAGDGHAGHVGVAVKQELAGGESRPAPAQAPHVQRGEGAQVARAELCEGLERKLATEVRQRERDGLQRSSRLPAVALRRRDVLEARRREQPGEDPRAKAAKRNFQ